MHLEPEKTVEKINTLFKNSKDVDYTTLKKVYSETLTLRSQVIGLMNDMEGYGYGGAPPPRKPAPQTHFVEKRLVTLVVPEPLPAQRELSSALEQHWISMIQEAIAKEAETGIPKWPKAHVWIEITAPRGTRNYQGWDVSNRAINMIINNLKGIFSRMMILSICLVKSKPGGVESGKPRSTFVPMKTAITRKLGLKNRKLHDLPKKIMEKPQFYRRFYPLPQTDLL